MSTATAPKKEKTRWEQEFESFIERVADKAHDEFAEDSSVEAHDLARYLLRAFDDEAGVGMDPAMVVEKIEEFRQYAIAIGYDGVEAYQHALSRFAYVGMEG